MFTEIKEFICNVGDNDLVIYVDHGNIDNPVNIELWDGGSGIDIMLCREDLEALVVILEEAIEGARSAEDRQTKERFLALENDRRERAYEAKCDELRDKERGL